MIQTLVSTFNPLFSQLNQSPMILPCAWQGTDAAGSADVPATVEEAGFGPANDGGKNNWI